MKSHFQGISLDFTAAYCHWEGCKGIVLLGDARGERHWKGRGISFAMESQLKVYNRFTSSSYCCSNVVIYKIQGSIHWEAGTSKIPGGASFSRLALCMWQFSHQLEVCCLAWLNRDEILTCIPWSHPNKGLLYVRMMHYLAPMDWYNGFCCESHTLLDDHKDSASNSYMMQCSTSERFMSTHDFWNIGIVHTSILQHDSKTIPQSDAMAILMCWNGDVIAVQLLDPAICCMISCISVLHASIPERMLYLGWFLKCIFATN